MKASPPKDNMDALIAADIAEEPRRWLGEFADALDFVADKLSPFSKESIKMACDVFPDGETLLEAMRKEWAGSMDSLQSLAEQVREAKDHLYSIPEPEEVRRTLIAAVSLLDQTVRQWREFESYCKSGPHVDWREPPPPEYEPLPPLELNKAFELAEAIRNDRVEHKLHGHAATLRVYCELPKMAAGSAQTPVSKGSKGKLGRPRIADDHVKVERYREFKAEWERERDTGIQKAEFCRSRLFQNRRMQVRDLEAILRWCRDNPA